MRRGKDRQLTDVDRLLERVARGGAGQCWLWAGSHGGGRPGSKSYGTYGTFILNGRTTSAHRAAWILLRGEIPDGIEVCHNCPGGDNPRCINPEHMFLGTRSQNQLDAFQKGRKPATRKLSDADISETARLRRQGLTLASIGAKFGVSRQAIHRRLSKQAVAA